jgi:hypothetical protein
MMAVSQRSVAFLLLALLLAVSAGCAIAGPDAERWPRFEASDPNSAVTIDYSPWARFLAKYLVRGDDGINRIAYGTVTAEDKAALATFVDALAATAVSRLNRAEQRAFWTNLYNALTIRVVLEHYPVKSIRDISLRFPGFGPWGKRLVTVEGERISLDDIEHRILRPIWRDPRTHYSVNCASLGCPNLASRPYTAREMEAMLDEAARAYVNHPRGARFKGNRLIVSSLYVWYRADFGGGDAGIIAHLRQYATGELAARLATATRIDDDGYDWSLNDAGTR